MNVAIVILNWNGEKLLKQFLPSVITHSKGADIYVVDNASSDNSLVILKEEFPNVKVISNDENSGFTGGYNASLKQIDAELYCLLNSDIKVTENWLKPIIDLFQENRDIAIVQPKILDLKNPEYFEYAGAAGGFIDKLGYPFCRGRIFQTLEKDMGQYNDTKEVFWATGACMFIRREVFWGLNGFDEDYFAHQEEVDLCWRAKNEGYRVFYQGKSEVYHLGGSTLKNSNPKKTFLNFRNSLYSITKNLPGKAAFPILLQRLVLDGIAAFRFFFQLRARHTLAILRAHASFYWNFRKIYRKREKANFILKYYATKSIVWSYFVHQVKNFNILVKD